MGMPPIKGVKFSRAVITVRPLPLELISSSKKRVGFLNMTAVFALPMEMLAPAEKVPSSRSSAIKLPPSSTTAITPPGACNICASAFAAAMTCSAPCSVSVLFSTVCASPTLAMKRIVVINPAHRIDLLRVFIAFRLSYVLKGATSRFESVRALLLMVLHDGRAKACLTQICFRPGAPDHDFGDVLHIAGKNNLFLVFVAEQGLLLELVEVVDVAVRVDNSPVRIRSVGNNEVVRQRKHALTITRAMGNVSFVCLRALELARGVHILGEG